jgi:hypothetical protein
MRTSTTLKIAGGAAVLASGCLLFLNTSQAGAASGGPPAWSYTYNTQGYAYDTGSSPATGADLVHIKIREGHKHTIVFKPLTPDNRIVGYNDVHVGEGYNAWYDPSKISMVQISFGGQSQILVTVNGNHCYYEDKHGNLQETTHGACTPK